MKATVTKPFDGAPDGAVYPRHFRAGDTVEGDLARVALREGWAIEADILIGVDSGLAGVPVEIPEGWERFNAAKSIELARALGAGEEIRTRAAAQEFIAVEATKWEPTG